MYYSIPGTLFHIYKERFFTAAPAGHKKVKHDTSVTKAAAGHYQAKAEASTKQKVKTRAAS